MKPKADTERYKVAGISLPREFTSEHAEPVRH